MTRHGAKLTARYQLMGWAKGQSGNTKGRPKTLFKEDFDNLVEKKKMYDLGLQITSTKWDEIIQAMADHAIAGNVQAANFLRDTFLGKPKETVQHDVTDEAKEGLRLAYSINGTK